MDWTGGTRRRFAPKKANAVLQKQKAYFAKARATFNTSTSHSTLRARGMSRDRISVSRSVKQSSLLLSGNSRLRDGNSKSDNPMQNANGPRKRIHDADRVSQSLRDPAKRKDRAPSVVSISSSDRSRSSSAGDHERPPMPLEPHLARIPSANSMNKEERLLLANRRRLLAQTDWLGLAPARPASVGFAGSGDKDRVGKRRKVERPKLRDIGLNGRRISEPLFGERLQQQGYLMSGALPTEDFQIKIGKDALATQTQVSRRSHTPANTSMRPPSTDLESLSEESMLLEADLGGFEALHVPYASYVPEIYKMPQTQHVCDVPNMTRSHNDIEIHERPNIGESYEFDTLQQTEHQYTTGYTELNDAERFADPQYLTYQSYMDAHGTATPLQQLHEPEPQHAIEKLSQPEDEEGTKHAAYGEEEEDDDDDDDDDEIWRKFLDVAQPLTSNPSTTAVKSSSLHVTSSESDRRPRLVHPDTGNEDRIGGVTRPLALRRMEDDDVHLIHQRIAVESAEKLLSPSTSLRQIIDLTNEKPLPEKNAQEEEEHALWREFICGDQDGSDTSSQILLADHVDDSVSRKAGTIVPASSSLLVSDLGTSNKTTIGGDTLVVENSVRGFSSQGQTLSSEHQIQPAVDLSSTRAHRPSSVVNHDTDSIEDVEQPQAHHHRPKNIHVARTTKSNPKRFLPPGRHQPSPPKRSSSCLPPRCQHNGVLRQEPVYL